MTRQSDLRWDPKYDLGLYARVKPWELRGSEPGALTPVQKRECRQNVSSKRRAPKTLVLRCECMSEVRGKPSRRFFGYDPIGEYSSLQEVQQAWEEHLRGNNADQARC